MTDTPFFLLTTAPMFYIFLIRSQTSHEDRLPTHHPPPSQARTTAISRPEGQTCRYRGAFRGKIASARLLTLYPNVLPGMTQEQALSIHPDALVLEADEPHYRKVFTHVLTSLQQISDRVEGADLGTAYVRLDGLEHLYGGEARLVNALLNAVPQDLNPRAGVAESKFPAFVAAITSDPLRATKVPSDVASFLAPHPVDLLPLSTDLKVALHRFGLHYHGRRGLHGSRQPWWTGSGPRDGRPGNSQEGIDDSPLIPLAHTETIVEHTSLPFSSASMDLLLHDGGHLVGESLLPTLHAGQVCRQGIS